MTKTYELPNNKMLMADIDEKHHTATVSVYVLDDLVESVNKTAQRCRKSRQVRKARGRNDSAGRFGLVI